MEKLLDYLLYALFGHNVTNVYTNAGSDNSALLGKNWTIVFEGQVYIILDENDLQIIRQLYDMREERLDDVERARFMRIFDICK